MQKIITRLRRACLVMSFVSHALTTMGQIKDTSSLFRGSLDAAVVSAHTNNFGINITPQQIKLAPALFSENDPLKIILSKPGIQNNSEGDVGLSIRGGDTDQNLILLENVPIYNPSHIKGFVSSFNPDIVSGIDIYTGSFPARYGSRLSGVVDIKTIEGDMSMYHGGITIGLLSSKAHIGGPIIKNRTSFIFSARKSYFPLLVGRIYNSILRAKESYVEQFSKIGYYDINVGITHKLQENNFIDFKFYNGYDNMVMKPKGDDISSYADNDTVKISKNEISSDEKWGNTAILLRWQTKNKSLSSSTYSYFSRYRHYTEDRDKKHKEYRYLNNNTFISSISEESSLLRKSGIEEYSIGSDLLFSSITNHSIEFGGQLSYQNAFPMILSTRTRNYSYAEKSDSIENATNMLGGEYHHFSISIYGEDDFTITKNLNISTGIRLTGYVLSNKFQIIPEPRIRCAFFITPYLSAKASYSRMSQAIHQLSTSNISAPSDLWVPSTNNLPIMTSNIISTGLWFEKRYNKLCISSSLEGYYKTMNNTLDYKDGISLIDQTNWEKCVSVGKGKSYGLEFAGNIGYRTMDISISYTLSKSTRQYDDINNGEWFYANNDSRHNLFIGFSYSPFKNFVVSSSFYYKTGRRFTISDIVVKSAYQFHRPVNINYSDFMDVIWYLQNTYSYLKKNDYKMEDYHRMDLTFNYIIPHKKFGKSSISLSFYNLYNHLNPYKIVIENQTTEVEPNVFKENVVIKKLCIFPFMPSISYSFEF